jgi:hypothetical protein
VALRERMLALAPSRRALALLAVLVLALAVLAVLVQAGSLTAVDQYSVDHWMRWLEPQSSHKTDATGFYRPFTLDSSNWIKALDIWTYPCSVLISGLVVIGTGIVLWRRLGPLAGMVPAAVWLVGNTLEVIGKAVISRPALFGTGDNRVRVHVASFDDSFPSGHMLRGVIVAAAIVFVWRRSLRWVLPWLLFVGPALVFASAHVVTDVVGGALLAVALLVPAAAVVEHERRRRVLSG